MSPRRFLRTLFGASFWCSLLTLLACSVGVAQVLKRQGSAVVIDETIMFSWPVMLLAVVSAAGYVTMVVANNNHRNDSHIHLTEEQMDARHPSREVCDLKHSELLKRLDNVDGMLRQLLMGQHDAEK